MKFNSRSSQLFSLLLSPSRLKTARLGALHYSLTSVLVLNFRFQIFREKNLASFQKINFFFEFCQVLNQELVGQNKKFLYICSFFYTVCRSTGVDLRRSSAKWWEFLSFHKWTFLFSFWFIDCFNLSLTFYLLTVSAKAWVPSDSWWSLWGRRGLGLYWGDCQWEPCHDHDHHIHTFYHHRYHWEGCRLQLSIFPTTIPLTLTHLQPLWWTALLRSAWTPRASRSVLL